MLAKFDIVFLSSCFFYSVGYDYVVSEQVTFLICFNRVLEKHASLQPHHEQGVSQVILRGIAIPFRTRNVFRAAVTGETGDCTP